MKRVVPVILFALLASVAVFSQPLTGIKSIPGNYASIKLAIEDLNLRGVGTGGVIFNVSADLKETFPNPTAGHITTLTGSAASPITFQKSGTGADPLITAGTGTGTMDAIFLVAGSDYVTFDGLSIQDNADNYDETTFTEWGFAVLKASGTDGSQHITIKNCKVSLNIYNTLAVGIYSNNHTASSTVQLAVTTASGANSSLKIYGNTITNAYRGIYLKGYADTAPYVNYDQNNEVGKDGANTITTIGGGNVIPYGIYASQQNNLTVANNTVTSTMEGSTSVYGIYLTASDNASFNLYGNSVSLRFTSTKDPNPGYNEYLNGIFCDMGANGTSNTANIYNNTVGHCRYFNPYSAVVNLLYLNNMGVTANVYGNIVSYDTIGAGYTEPTGFVRYFYCRKASTTSGPLVVHNNTVSNCARVAIGTENGSVDMFTIFGSGTTLQAYNNLISDISIASTGAAHGIYIYYNDASGKYVHDNSVINLTEANGSVTGLYNGNGTAGYIYNNKIQGIHSSVSSQYAFISGITHNSGIQTYYYNNMVSDLSNPGTVATLGYDYNMLNGINVEGSSGNSGFYNNTVYLDAPAYSPEFGSSAFCAQYLTGIDLRNNIFVNASASAGTNGKSVCIRSRSTGFTGFTSNYNDLYAGTPGPSNLIFSNPAANDQTLAQYQARVAPNESQSVTTLPPFVNILATPYDLHLKTNFPTSCESGAVAVLTPAITSDIDGDPRYPNAGYPVNPSYTPTAPDLGADEFGGLPKDVSPPSIVYTPLMDINNGNARTLTAVITDASGVPVSGFGLPVLYWKKNNLAYVSAQGSYAGNDTYTFTFGAGAVLNDIISYYIVAQDNVAPFPNVGAFPAQGAAGFTANPPVCVTPPSTPSSYKVISDISGIRHVGIGKDYTTLTAAANDLNAKYMAGAVTLILDDNSYPNETFPIYFNERPGNSNVNTLTIKPNSGATPLITGSSAAQAILVFNGIDFATLDGSNNGSASKDLTIENTSSTHLAQVIAISNHNGTDPSRFITIKNCTLKAQKLYVWGISNDAATYLIAINSNGGSSGGGYDNCLITGNSLLRARVAIDISAATGNPNRNITISNNVIGSIDTNYCVQRYGIAVSNSDNTLIADNDIIGHAQGVPLSNMFGILYYGSCTNTKIHRNKIHDWNGFGTGSYGIKCSGTDNSTVTEIFNNLIYNIKTPGMNPGPSNNNAYGIFIRVGGNIKIWHNTIHLSGPGLNGFDSFAPSSACICTYTAESNNLDIRDNILRNSMTNPANPGPGSGATGRAYAIQHSGTSASFSALDNNDYYIDGYNGTIGQTWIPGMGPTGEYVTLVDWQGYTGKDAASLNLNPVFASDVDPQDLHPTNMDLNSVGGPKILDTDNAGAVRYNPTDMGAFEWSKLITDFHTLPATAVTGSGATLHGDINTNGEVVQVFFDYGTTASYGSVANPVPGTVRSVGTLLPVSTVLTGLLPNTTYHFRFWGVPTTSGQANVYGTDMTFTTPGVPGNTTVTTNISNDTCINATQTITLGGTPNTCIVGASAHLTLIAGQNILLLPGTRVLQGGYLHGFITTTSQYCNALKASAALVANGETEIPGRVSVQGMVVYPNPTTGTFTVELSGEGGTGQAEIEIYTMQGDRISRSPMATGTRGQLSLSDWPSGIYIVRAVSDSGTSVARIVKQ